MPENENHHPSLPPTSDPGWDGPPPINPEADITITEKPLSGTDPANTGLPQAGDPPLISGPTTVTTNLSSGQAAESPGATAEADGEASPFNHEGLSAEMKAAPLQEGDHPRRRDAHRRLSNPKKKGLWMGIGLIVLGILAIAVLYFWQVWSSVEKTVQKIQVPRGETHQQVRAEPVELDRKEPFSVLILGLDTGEYGRTEKGRSDVIVVATVNPHTERISLTSIPRDTYTEIVGKGTMDKINHAYTFGGTSMAANSIQNLLGIPIDYTVTANMKGFKEVVDAVGGITVVPPQTFSQGGFDFVKGQSVHMTGTMALEYIRNRKDSGGDYGRQERARQVVHSLVQSALEFDSLLNYQKILDSLSNNVTVDMSKDEILKLVFDYRPAANNIHEYQLNGETEIINGIYYEVMDNNRLATIQNALRKELEIGTRIDIKN